MSVSESKRLWPSREDLEAAINASYSVGNNPQKMKSIYTSIVKQYPLYLAWFTKVIDFVAESNKPLDVREYGPGPGFLAKMLVLSPNVHSYEGIEPNSIFRKMTENEIGEHGTVTDGLVETFVGSPVDIEIATAAYHHFPDKITGIKQLYRGLRPGGRLIIADVFTEDYDFDHNYDPVDRLDFVNKMARYAAGQILGMPSPTSADVEDQLKTFLLDTLRLNELKVCPAILHAQLSKAGFENIEMERMEGKNPSIDYASLNYYFITAEKPCNF